MTYSLGGRSLARCLHVSPRMMAIVHAAIADCPVDFGFSEEQSRTLAQQRQKVADGVSKTLKSPHLIDAVSGVSRAVDLVPWIDGKFQWGDGQWRVRTASGVTLQPFFDIAAAMQRAAIHAGVRVIWGGVWDRALNELPPGADGLRKALEAYKVRHPGPDFVDGPHFELAR